MKSSFINKKIGVYGCMWCAFLCFAAICSEKAYGKESYDESQSQISGEKVSIESEAPKISPTIVFDNTTYDFGIIKPFSKNLAIYSLKNKGKGVLKITEVKGCCGTVVKLTKHELAPGQNGFVSAEYKAGPESNKLDKKITLTTNDPNHPIVVLTFTGQVVETLKWSPKRLEVAVWDGDVNCPPITIRSLDKTKYAVKAVASTEKCFSMTYDPNAFAEIFVFKPKFDAKKIGLLPGGKGVIKILLNHPNYQEISVGFVVTPPITAVPGQILAFNAEPNKVMIRSFKLMWNTKHPKKSEAIEIDSIVSSQGNDIKIKQTKPIENGCEVALQLRPSSPKLNTRFTTDNLTILLKDGSTVIVPLRIFYAA